jgi:hypothetical protein
MTVDLVLIFTVMGHATEKSVFLISGSESMFSPSETNI